MMRPALTDYAAMCCCNTVRVMQVNEDSWEAAGEQLIAEEEQAVAKAAAKKGKKLKQKAIKQHPQQLAHPSDDSSVQSNLVNSASPMKVIDGLQSPDSVLSEALQVTADSSAQHEFRRHAWATPPVASASLYKHDLLSPHQHTQQSSAYTSDTAAQQTASHGINAATVNPHCSQNDPSGQALQPAGSSSTQQQLELTATAAHVGTDRLLSLEVLLPRRTLLQYHLQQQRLAAALGAAHILCKSSSSLAHLYLQQLCRLSPLLLSRAL